MIGIGGSIPESYPELKGKSFFLLFFDGFPLGMENSPHVFRTDKNDKG